MDDDLTLDGDKGENKGLWIGDLEVGCPKFKAGKIPEEKSSTTNIQVLAIFLVPKKGSQLQ